MNRIVNNYGAVNNLSLLLAEMLSLQETVETRVRDIIANNDLTPEEIICLEHKLIGSVSAECAVGILRKAINMRKAEREADKKTIDVDATVTKRGCSPDNRKTPVQWSDKFGVEVVDPDGWDRASKDWQAEWNRPLTQSQFIEKFQRSTTRVVDRVKYQTYKHLFQ